MAQLRIKNKRPFLVIGAAIIIVGLVAIINHNHAKPAFAARQACSILTPAIARQLDGGSLTQQPEPAQVTDTTRTTYCVYRGINQSVALVVRSARNASGVALNKQAFSVPVTTSVPVHGYGDAAYWSPAFAQLNILDHNTWYILSNGSDTTSQRTLADAKKLADLVAPQL